MRLKWLKRLDPSIQTLFLAGLIIALVLFYIIGLSKYLQPAATSLLGPPLKFFQAVSANARQFLTFHDLVEENKRLKAKIEQLSGQLVQLQETALENERLRNLLTLSERETLTVQPALVIGKDSSNWTRTIIIDRGRKSGIEKGMAVVLGSGLAGRVIEVDPFVSTVALITDFDSKIPAKIIRTREEGIVFGDSSFQRGNCKMKYIHQAEIGDKVISSGLGGIYPKGLLIGEVINVAEQKDKLYQIAEIKPTVELPNLEEVLVITGQ